MRGVRSVLPVFPLLVSALWAQPLPPRSRAAAQEVTFSNQIVRIFQQNCQVCHHTGGIGPFSLMSYREARPYFRNIRKETQARRMPPWKPVAGHGEFLGERRLTQGEIDLIARWVDAGAPEGDPRDLPQRLEFPDEWSLGTPDVVLEPEGDFTVPAEGRDIYRCFSIPTRLLQNRHLTKLEFRPGNRAVVHHVLLFQDAVGASARLNAAGDPQPGYNCGAFVNPDILGLWTPGGEPQVFPPGVGIRTMAGSRVIMQVHYHSGGTPQTDRTQVGLYFNRDPIQKELLYLPVLNPLFVIPPGEARHTVTASFTVPPLVNARAISIFPHMHLLGREMRVEAVYRDGSRRPMIYIDDWDFNWQAIYYYRTPVPLPSFTRIELTAVYDNSAANPNNPYDPPRAARWGEQTTDEMCLAFIGITLD